MGVFLVTMMAHGQSIPRLTEMADRLYENGRFLEAIEFYDKIASIDKKNYEARYKLGMSYLKALNYAKAEATFFALGSISDPANEYRAKALYKYAAILKMDYKFEAADSILGFTIFISSDETLIESARKQKEGCLLAMKQAQVDKGFEIEEMEDVNSKYHDFGGIINPGNRQLVFATTRNLGGVQYQGNQFKGVLPDLTTYEYARDKWRPNANAQRFDRLNTKWSEGAGTFTSDGQAFYFSSCRDENGSGCKIMVSYLEDDRWGEPTALNEYINESGSENIQPSISTTGDTLFFSSDRTGGHGGSDIWMSLRGIEKDSWGPAINMGHVINSSEDDISPYYSSVFNCLVFSSNGHVGYGGYDLYAAKGESFFEPELYSFNRPFNSPLDDIYFNISKEIGFLASNRQDRKTLNLYSFDVSDEALFLSLLISGESMIDGQIISRFRDTRSLDLFAFRVEDYQGYELFAPEKRQKPRPSIIREKGEEVEEDNSAAAAVPSLPPGYPYAKGAGDLTIDYEHLYFKHGSSWLGYASRKALKELAGQLRTLTYTSIEVLAYTDVIGTEQFNQKLSEQRGASVKRYLVELGVPADKVIIRARGEGPLSERKSWYAKMFSRRAEVLINSEVPFSLQRAKPLAVRHENTIASTAAQLGIEEKQLRKHNTFASDTVKAGDIIRVDRSLNLTPAIKYFLEEDDLRNTFFVYTVKPDETLEKIAEKYNTPEELIAEVNDIRGEVLAGDEIFIYKVQ